MTKDSKSKKNKLTLWLVVAIAVIAAVMFFTKKDHNNAKDTNVLKVAIMGDPGTLDPNFTDSTWGQHVIVNFFTGLTTIDEHGKVIPGVAKSWKISNGGHTYIFHLRKSMWSDGVPVTAHDFEYSIKRLLNPKMAAPFAGLLYIIKGAEKYNAGQGKASDVGVQALNNNTLKITLRYPASFFLSLASHVSMLPVPKHIVEKLGKKWDHPGSMVVNGAYQLKSRVRKSNIVAVKNDRFYDSKNTKIGKIVFLTQQDISALLDRYRAKEIDWITLFGSTQYDWIKANIPNDARIAPFAGTEIYTINIHNKKFKNPKVRLALNMAVDRKYIVNRVIKTGEIPAYSFIPPMKNYVSVKPYWSKWSLSKRTANSIKLLKDAGYTKSHPLKFILSYNTSKDHRAVAVATVAMWNKLDGLVRAQLQNQDVTTHYNGLKSGDYEVGRAAWVADYDDPSDFVSLFLKGAPNNWPKYYSKNYQRHYWAAMKSRSRAGQMQQYQTADRILTKANVVIPIFYYVSRNLISTKIKGWATNPLDVHLIQYMYFVDGAK